MTLRDAEGAYLRQAKDIASGLIDELQDGDEIFLLAAAGQTSPPDPFRNASAARDALERIEVSAADGSLPRAVARAAQALGEAAHPNRELYVLSDLQATSLADTVHVGVNPDARHPLRIWLLPVGGRPHPNVAVAEVRVDSRIVEVGRPIRLSATLVNYGSDVLDGYVVSVFLEGRRLAQSAARLPPGVSVDVPFTVTPASEGWLAGMVRLENDAFAFDDEYHFTVHVPGQRRILVVRGEGQDTGFLELATSPDLDQNRVAFETEVIPETRLAAVAPGAFDAIVLAGVRSLSSGEVVVLERYVSEGGGLLLTPSTEGGSQAVNALLDALGGGHVSGFSGEVGSSRAMAAFDRMDIEHPLFEGMFRDEGLGHEPQVETPEIYRVMRYVSGGGGEAPLIRLSSGDPFLQEILHGRGRILLLAVALDTGWSDLPVRGLFIPLVYRSLYYLSASESTAGEQLKAARDAELRLVHAGGAALLRLIGPGGAEYVPEQRDLFGAVLLRLDGTAVERPGVYDVVGGGDGTSGDGVVRRIAFNVDELESDLAVLTPDEGREWLTAAVDLPIEIVPVDGRLAGEVIAAVAEQRIGRELWRVFLLLALAFLAAEMVLARRWRPEAVQ